MARQVEAEARNAAEAQEALKESIDAANKAAEAAKSANEAEEEAIQAAKAIVENGMTTREAKEAANTAAEQARKAAAAANYSAMLARYNIAYAEGAVDRNKPNGAQLGARRLLSDAQRAADEAKSIASKLKRDIDEAAEKKRKEDAAAATPVVVARKEAAANLPDPEPKLEPEPAPATDKDEDAERKPTTPLTQVLDAMSEAASNLCASDKSDTNTSDDTHLQQLLEHAEQLHQAGPTEQQRRLFETFVAATKEYVQDLSLGNKDKEKCSKVLETFTALADSYDTSRSDSK